MFNEYRDEAERFMRRMGDFQQDAEKKLDWLREEFDLLRGAVNQGDQGKTAHQIYDMLFLLLELAADSGVDLDAEWEKGRRRKAEKYPAAGKTGGEAPGTVELRERTEAHVREYFRRTRDGKIRRMLPGGPETEDAAVENFRRTLRPGASSYGKTVYAGGRYVGDVWITGIHEEDTPDAMLSCCVFDDSLWGCGVATEAVRKFLPAAAEKYGLRTIGAFAYAENAASLRVLEKSGFAVAERFTEDGMESCYCLLRLPES